jgi:hypothetical protein
MFRLRSAKWFIVNRATLSEDSTGFDLDHLYFIEGAGLIKIGRSKDVTSRMAALTSGSPAKLNIIGHVQRRGWEEPIWHLAFHDLRSHGEWFDGGPALREAIELALSKRDWTKALGPLARPMRLVVIQFEKAMQYADFCVKAHPEAEGRGWDKESVNDAYARLLGLPTHN